MFQNEESYGAASSALALSGADLCRDFSLEMTAKDRPKVEEAAGVLPPGTQVSVTFLPNEAMPDRIEAAATLRRNGLEPTPHISARRIKSEAELEGFLESLTGGEAAVKQVFVIAGDPDTPEGPYEDSLAVLKSGLLTKYGIERVGIAGYPEGHPKIGEDKLWQALHDKRAVLADAGLPFFIMTQFGFDADAVLEWLARLRRDGIEEPVRVGVAGPANVKTLLKFAAMCGVGASAKVMARYGISITKVFSEAGPEPIINELTEGLAAEHGATKLHFYPFGGLLKTANWVREFSASHQAPA